MAGDDRDYDDDDDDHDDDDDSGVYSARQSKCYDKASTLNIRRKQLTSSVFTRFLYSGKTAPTPGGHVFDRSGPFSNSSEMKIKPIFSQSFMMIGKTFDF
ncbi:hypothetical protein DPMN_169237 [Dreissena polymorpha]|uniref:Uncharacterized protein n=1 Tax=Dreissena polymorpha TaxID=45954 RepID=A0A9D4F839_DREPO|nr:hypothetical protein DPMN_169237 [Dreissena polymorpha]